MATHWKPKNVQLTRISRLNKGAMNFPYKPASDADKAITGQHLGFEVAYQALVKLRGY